MRKFYFLALVIASVTVGCSKDNQGINNSPVSNPLSPIQLSAGIEVTAGSRAAIDGVAFPKNTSDVFRVSAFAGNAAPTDWTTDYFSDKAVNSDASALSFAITQYYPSNGDKLYFYAWAPQGTVSAGSGATAPVVNYTLTGQEDIMAAQHTTGIAKSTPQNTNPSFAFTHKLKQVKFKLVADASFVSGTKVTSINVKNAKTAAKLDISTGILTFDATTGDLPLPITVGKDEITTSGTTMDGCIMFETGATFTVAIVAGGVTYDNVAITLTGSNAGEAGVSHTVTLTFKRGGVSVAATIADWELGEDVNVPIQ